MRILYHHRTQAGDAQGVHINEMVKAFRDLGHVVDVVALVQSNRAKKQDDQGRLWNSVRKRAPNWLYELLGLLYNFYGYSRLSQAISVKKPDLVYERYSLNTFCGILASRRFSIPLVLEVNAPLYYEQKNLGKLTFKRVARFSERWICSRSTKTIVVSEAMRRYLLEEGVPDDKMTVIPNGIDPESFHPQIQGQPVRRKYGLEGKVVVGFVGWFRKWHGVEMLLEAARSARLAERDVAFLLVGDGPAYEDLISYATRHRMMSSVIFTGPVDRDKIPEHIAAMDITVQPSATDYASPIKIFEYMGMGKTIIAPDQPNIREILQDGINSYLFRPGDTSHLGHVLSEVIDNLTVVRESVGQKAYATTRNEGYLWSKNAERILDQLFNNASTKKSEVILKMSR